MKLIIKNKKGLEFKLAFYSIVILSMTIIAVGIHINEWNTVYESGLVYDLGEYNELDAMSGRASGQQGNMSVKSSVQGEEFESTTIRAVYGILNNIYAPFRVVFGNDGMLDSVTERFGLPDYIRQGLVTLMFFAITFSLIAILFRLTRRNA